MRDRPLNEPCSCGPGCDCGCCEGTEPLTPRSIANRPGLDALSYRVGTHATFLETMKARLSSQAFPALAGLTTREPGDASLALLDAWAVVADVLTFYQERIANEGYLRTATERRSVLELARLVGYVPRPGVAASTYLAYLLDEGPETVIPAGAAARSVPGPGEMPQTFETTDDLIARAAWNNLQVRLTLPQRPEKLTKAESWPVALYFKGIATSLKPNDPLLIKTGGPKPDLFRVVMVEPDAVKDRTRVDVQLWLKPADSDFQTINLTPKVLEPAEALQEIEASTEALREILERASDLETLKISRGAIARRALSHLEPVKAALDAGAGESELRAAIDEALPKLRDEHGIAVEKNANRLEPWIRGLMANLEETKRRAAPNAVPDLGSAAGPESLPPSEVVSTVDECAGTTDLSKVLSSLGKPPRPQPRSGSHLQRDPHRLFGSRSDLRTRLLAAAQPELANVLYTAWTNVPVTKSPALEVWALHTRASVFGHNAPLKPVRNAAGVIVGGEEWELRSAGAGESFNLTLRPFLDGFGGPFKLGLQIAIASVSLSNEEVFSSLVAGQSFLINHPKETISFKVLEVPGSQQGLPFRFELHFQNRGVVIAVRGWSDPQAQHVEATSSLPGRVRANFVPLPADILTNDVALRGASGFPQPQPAPVVSGLFESIEVEGTIPSAGEDEKIVFLDNSYPQIKPDCWIVLERPDSNLGSPLVITTGRTVKDVSLAVYGITGKSTRVELNEAWLELDPPPPGQKDKRDTFAVIRGTSVYAQCEELELAEEPIDPVARALCGGEIELAHLYDGLQPGRWLIVSGERTDVAGVGAGGEAVRVSGVPAAELAMVAAVEQGVRPSGASVSGDSCETRLAGDRTHTTLTLAKPLAYCYKLDTIKIYGNVAHATHGETRFEVMGSGDAAKPHQSFTLKQPPLTYVSAPTPSGIESTLQARVNDVLWHEADCPAGLGPADRRYFVRIGDGGQTTVIFGDGQRGARLPTGSENVRARYRSGIGKQGNVKAGQISQLATRPLGVKDVINPIPATGGAGPESRDQARRNAPLAVTALDRLFSVQDYADFARTFAGVGKTSAARLSDGRVELVHVTIAGEDDIPIREDSDLFLNLEEALLRFGEPRQPLALAVRRRFFLVVQAEVQLLPDFLWEKVEPKIRAAMVEAFGIARRDLGQDAVLSEVYRTVQGVPGVDYVDVNLFTKRDPESLEEPLDLTNQPRKRLAASLARIEKGEIKPAQLLYLTPEVADTLILKERKS
jgi:Baseplate J-like protein